MVYSLILYVYTKYFSQRYSMCGFFFHFHIMYLSVAVTPSFVYIIVDCMVILLQITYVYNEYNDFLVLRILQGMLQQVTENVISQ